MKWNSLGQNMLVKFHNIGQRLFNYIDYNEKVNQLLAPLEVGHKISATAKIRVLRLPVCICLNVANSR